MSSSSLPETRVSTRNSKRKSTHQEVTSCPGLVNVSKRLCYILHVIKETFRLNPTIDTIIRVALRDTTLPTGDSVGGGEAPIYINKRNVVVFSLYVMHRRKVLFGEDAGTHRPERWETLRPTAWSYLPFGGGPRFCSGQYLALIEMAYTTVKKDQAFRAIESLDPVLEFVEVYKVTLESKNGAKISFVV